MALPSPSDDARPAVSTYEREPTLAPREEREGLSFQTLMIAAIASAAAAIVVSRLWDKGTIVASAMTPVIVALISEGLRRPMQSTVVRRPVRAVGSVAASRRTWRRGEARPPSGRTPTVMAPPTAGVDEGLRQREEGLEAGPVRVYSSGSNRRPRAAASGGRRRLHLKIAIVTGLVGFVIAALALTLPELIFGGSVTGHRSTTYFGGGAPTKTTGKAKDAKTNNGKSGAPTKNQDQPASTGDQTTTPDQSTSTTTTTPGSGAAPPTQPTQPPPTTPAQPAPTTPAPPTPTP